MRPVQLADIETAARVLMLAKPSTRADFMAKLLERAERADSYRQATGRPHPRFGTGTLMSAAAPYPKAGRVAGFLHDDLHAIHCVIDGLMERTKDQPV